MRYPALEKLNKTVGLIDFALPLGRNMPRIYTEKINNWFTGNFLIIVSFYKFY